MNLCIGWIKVPRQGDELRFSQLSGHTEHRSVEATRTLCVCADLTWHVTVNSKKLPCSAGLFSSIPNIISSVNDLQQIFKCVHGSVLCIGNDDDRFQSLQQGRNGLFMDKAGTGNPNNAFPITIVMHAQLQGSLVLPSMMSRAPQFAVWHVNYLFCPNDLLILVGVNTATSIEKPCVP